MFIGHWQILQKCRKEESHLREERGIYLLGFLLSSISWFPRWRANGIQTPWTATKKLESHTLKYNDSPNFKSLA